MMDYLPEDMLNNLKNSLTILPDILSDRAKWDSLIVNRRKPYTYRVFTTLPSGLRCCLHKFDPCHTHEAFAHPHPWPGAFVVLKGKYKMNVGFTDDRFNTYPHNVMSLILNKHSMYEIINPMTWHSVIPLEETYTIMVNGKPWDTTEEAHTSVRTTAGKDLERMPEPDLLKHLELFKELVSEWNNGTRSSQS